MDILQLGLNRILNLIGFYLSFLLVIQVKKIAFTPNDLLTNRGIEVVGLVILVYFITYTLIYSTVYLLLINFSDWIARKRLEGTSYEDIKPWFDNLGKKISFITKTSENEIGTYTGQALTLAYQYSLFVVLITLQLSVLLNKQWCWFLLVIVSIATLLMYIAIFILKQIHALYFSYKEEEEKKKQSQ